MSFWLRSVAKTSIQTTLHLHRPDLAYGYIKRVHTVVQVHYHYHPRLDHATWNIIFPAWLMILSRCIFCIFLQLLRPAFRRLGETDGSMGRDCSFEWIHSTSLPNFCQHCAKRCWTIHFAQKFRTTREHYDEQSYGLQRRSEQRANGNSFQRVLRCSSYPPTPSSSVSNSMVGTVLVGDRVVFVFAILLVYDRLLKPGMLDGVTSATDYPYLSHALLVPLKFPSLLPDSRDKCVGICHMQQTRQ